MMPIIRAPSGEIVTTTDAADVRALTGAGEAQVRDLVGIAPLLTGSYGRAWMIDYDELRRVLKAKPGSDSGLVAWVIEAPWAHPIWHSYLLGLIHLRPIEVPDPEPLRIYLEGATHEIVLFALNPEAKREPIILGKERPGPHFLHPKQFTSQFIEVDDRLAIKRVREAVQEVVDRKLSPDAGEQLAWKKRFGSAMFKDGFR